MTQQPLFVPGPGGIGQPVLPLGEAYPRAVGSKVDTGPSVEAAQAMRGGSLLTGPLMLECVFVFCPPASAPKRVAALIAAGYEIPKTTRPDLKNLIAGVEDGANGILWRDDGQIYDYGHSRKIYGPRAEVRVTVTAMEAQGAVCARDSQLALV